MISALDDGVAVIDHHFRSRDVLGFIRQQVQHHIGNVLRFTDAQCDAGFLGVFLGHQISPHQ